MIQLQVATAVDCGQESGGGGKSFGAGIETLPRAGPGHLGQLPKAPPFAFRRLPSEWSPNHRTVVQINKQYAVLSNFNLFKYKHP